MKQNAIKKPRREFRVVTLEEDGISHINVGSAATTELGKQLSMVTNLGFQHPYLGPFRTHEGFRRYVIHPNPSDTLRYTFGTKMATQGKIEDRLKRTHYRRIVIDGYYLKIKQNPTLLELFKNSNLPFEQYFVNETSGIVINHSTAAWHTEALMEMHTALKNDQERTLVTFDEYQLLVK